MSHRPLKDDQVLPDATEINNIRAFLVSIGVPPQDAAKLATTGVTRFGITNNIRNYAKGL